MLHIQTEIRRADPRPGADGAAGVSVNICRIFCTLALCAFGASHGVAGEKWPASAPGTSASLPKSLEIWPKTLRAFVKGGCTFGSQDELQGYYGKVHNVLDFGLVASVSCSNGYTVQTAVFYRNNEVPERAQFVTGNMTRGFRSIDYLGYVELDPKSGKIDTVWSGDTCRKSNPSYSYELRRNIYALTEIAEVPCWKTRPRKVLWKAKNCSPQSYAVCEP